MPTSCQRGARSMPQVLLLSTLAALPLVAPVQLFAKDPIPKPVELKQHAGAGLAGLHIYSTFGCLGLASDLYETKQYDAAKVQQIAGDVVKTSELAVELLKSARAADGKAADDVPYEDLIQCYYLLDREARLLAAAAKTGEKEALQRCQQAREETWAKVREVLGIAEPPQAEPKSKPQPQVEKRNR